METKNNSEIPTVPMEDKKEDQDTEQRGKKRKAVQTDTLKELLAKKEDNSKRKNLMSSLHT